MDYLTKKELDGLKQDIMAKDIAVEADKYVFETKLLNGMGENMMNELRTPTKPNLWTGIKVKFARWRQKRKEMKEYRNLMKELEEINNDIKKEMGGD